MVVPSDVRSTHPLPYEQQAYDYLGRADAALFLVVRTASVPEGSLARWCGTKQTNNRVGWLDFVVMRGELLIIRAAGGTAAALCLFC